MKIQSRDVNLKEEEISVPMDAVITLENGNRIVIFERDGNLEIQCGKNCDLKLIASNSFIIKQE